MPKAIPIDQIIGVKFGRLTPSREVAKRKSFRHFECLCDCGKTIEVSLNSFRSGNSTSCGCYNKQRIVEQFTTHGEGSKKNGLTAEYRTWTEIKKRCNSNTRADRQYYSKKGISVCPEWENSYEAFLADMGRKPSPKHTLDRIDNSKGYFRENCRWATMAMQTINKTNNRVLSYRGVSKTMREWATDLQVNYFTLRTRLHDGWSIERAFETPMNGVKKIDRARGSGRVHKLA